MNSIKLKLSSYLFFSIFSLYGQDAQKQDNIDELWCKGLSCFLAEDYRCSVKNFDELLHSIDTGDAKFNAANFYLACSYQSILKTSGINHYEADRMFECYKLYLNSPVKLMNQENNQKLAEFVDRKRKLKPKNNFNVWTDRSQ